MDYFGKLQVTTVGQREIVMKRSFNAPRHFVFDALTQPQLLKQWLLGPPGWTMPVCEIDLRVGGAYRYEWHRSNGAVMGVSGVFREIVIPERYINTEKFDEPWYPGEALINNSLVEHAGYTTLTLTIQYDSEEIRDAVLRTPMEQGVGQSYNNLEQLLPSLQSQTGGKSAGQS